MAYIKILFLSIGCSVGYGLVHNQITARICIEYFTVGHPQIIDTQSPTLLGLYWGVASTWWMGLLFGILVAVCSRVGERPELEPGQLLRPILVLLACVAALALVGGLTGYFLGRTGAVRLVEPIASRVPADVHLRYLVALWVHLGSYCGGLVGGIILCFYAVMKRGKLTKLETDIEASASG